VRWSVGVEVEAGRVVTREEVVELADAIAPSGGIASGIGTDRYGGQLIVEAGGRDEATGKAVAELLRAAAAAGLPAGPVVRAEAISETEDEVEAP
jgi:hypothetical protein